ncbi:hypothetical protein AMTRI_Chr04g251880 [Amborella trichopoda]
MASVAVDCSATCLTQMEAGRVRPTNPPPCQLSKTDNGLIAATFCPVHVAHRPTPSPSMQATCTTSPTKSSTHLPPAPHLEKVSPLTSHHPTFIPFGSMPQSLHLPLPGGISPSYTFSIVTTALNAYHPVTSTSSSFPPATSSCMSAPLPLVSLSSPLDQQDASTPTSDIPLLPPLIDLHFELEADQGTFQTSSLESTATEVPTAENSSVIRFFPLCS